MNLQPVGWLLVGGLTIAIIDRLIRWLRNLPRQTNGSVYYSRNFSTGSLTRCKPRRAT